MSPAVPHADLGAFLDLPFTAAIATIRADGTPQQVPVWYRWDGEAILVWTDESRAWFRNLLRDDRVSVAVFESAPPWGATIIRGRASHRTGEERELIDECRRITARYVPAGEVDAVLARWVKGPQTIVRVEPVAISAWAEQSGEAG
jgi:PPOX class probable F420-dependent enzyme